MKLRPAKKATVIRAANTNKRAPKHGNTGKQNMKLRTAKKAK